MASNLHLDNLLASGWVYRPLSCTRVVGEGEERQYADRCVALAAISVAILPVKFSTGPWWEKNSGAIPVAASPFFPPFSCLSKVGLAGQIAARFTLLAAYYGAATLPAYPPASLIGATPG